MRKYIFIQRNRFNNAFDCVFDIEDEAEAFPVYKMLLQPLIENCISHGFEGIKNNGRIFVQAYVAQDDYLQISVQDNGRGMKEKKLAELKNLFADPEQSSDKNIGLENVSSRLKIYYEGKASLSISSEENRGTTIIIRIPHIQTTTKSKKTRSIG